MLAPKSTQNHRHINNHCVRAPNSFEWLSGTKKNQDAKRSIGLRANDVRASVRTHFAPLSSFTHTSSRALRHLHWQKRISIYIIIRTHRPETSGARARKTKDFFVPPPPVRSSVAAVHYSRGGAALTHIAAYTTAHSLLFSERTKSRGGFTAGALLADAQGEWTCLLLRYPERRRRGSFASLTRERRTAAVVAPRAADFNNRTAPPSLLLTAAAGLFRFRIIYTFARAPPRFHLWHGC